MLECLKVFWIDITFFYINENLNKFRNKKVRLDLMKHFPFPIIKISSSILIGHFIKHKPCIFWRAHQQLLWLVLYYFLFLIMEYYKLYIHFFARALEKTRYYSCSLQVLHKDDKAHQLFLIGYLRNLWQIKK